MIKLLLGKALLGCLGHKETAECVCFANEGTF